jgi:hypothetical protein
MLSILIASLMPDVLIRDVLADDLELIRETAAQQGKSLQKYLHDAVHSQADYLRRQAALARTANRLRDRPEVPVSERLAVLDAIASEHAERADQLSQRPNP